MGNSLDSLNASAKLISARLEDVCLEKPNIGPKNLGLENVPLVSLKEACKDLEKIIPRIQECADNALKRKYEKTVSHDEASAIFLYTMEWVDGLYKKMNASLRSEDADQIKPYIKILKLILNGFVKLPAVNKTVYRGVKKNLSSEYKQGDTVTWSAFSSTTVNVKVLESEAFFGQSGDRTFFTIVAKSGRDIAEYSAIETEEEVLLPPGISFKVTGVMKTSDLYIITLEEV